MDSITPPILETPEELPAAGTTDPSPATDRARHDALRAEVRRIQAKLGCPMTDIAKEAGIAYGTFSQWVGGTYAGRVGKYDDLVQRWLENRGCAARARASLPEAPAFLLTQAAQVFHAAFEHAQYAPDIAVVSGAAGVGKTTSIEAYRAQSPNVWVFTGEPCISTPRMMLDELADLLGVTESRSTHKVSRALVERMRGTKGLLVVDEAQHLGTTTLDQVRTLHDLAQVGVALVGNEAVASRIEGGKRRAEFAQLFSRVGIKVSRARANRADVDALLDAWGVTATAERKLASAVARTPGALRVMTKVLRMAAMQARAAGDEGIPARFIQMAWQQLASAPLEVVA